MTYTVEVDGRAASWESGVSLNWLLQSGPVAPIQRWELPRQLVDDVVAAKAGKEITLRVRGPYFDRTIERVIVLGNAPSGRFTTQMLLLTDVRWYFTRAWLVRDANVRRKLGDTRLVGDVPVQNQVPIDTIKYAPWSLKNGTTPYQWESFGRDVLDESTTAKEGRPVLSYLIEPSPTLGIDAAVIEETYVDDAMPTGIAKALGALPGRDMFVDFSGLIRIFDRAPGAEDAMIRALPPAILNKGKLRRVDWSAARPARYHVLFTPELEVLLSKTQTQGADDAFLENVIPVTDAKLSNVTYTPPGGAPAVTRDVGRGSYITLGEAYKAWGVPPTNLMGALTDDIVRTHYLSNFLYLNAAMGDNIEPDILWSARLSALANSYRVLFRVNPRFWARVRNARTVRAAIWDTATGTRAPSPVFCDHAKRFTLRALIPGNRKLGANFTSYATTVASCTPAPATLELIDEELGIFAFNWQADVTGAALDIAPSKVEIEPTLDVTADPTGANVAVLWPFCKLVADTSFNCSTIVSLVPAGPNDERRLYSVDVAAKDALAFLKLNASVSQESKGPDMTLRVRGGITTARFAWTDDQSSNILAVFGVGQPANASPETRGNVLKALTPINLESELKPVAMAVAAADMLSRFDHWEGTQGVPFDGDLRPIGTVGVVEHRFQQNEATTWLAASVPSAGFDVMSALPQSVRKTLGREL